MSEKRFVYGVIKGSRQAHIRDCKTCKSATIDVYDDNIKYFVDLLNEQQAIMIKLRNENIILKNKIKDLRVSLFMQDKELQRQMQKSDLDE